MSIKQPNGTDTSERGPSWWDVCATMSAMQKQHGRAVLVTLRNTSGRDGTWGVHVTVNLEGIARPKGHGSYGKAFPGNGQKTVAAAIYRALLQLDDEMAKAWLDGNYDTDDDLPF